jgi:DNA-binding transcriptional LysR family regulator
MADWAESCTSCTRDWSAAQERIPRATREVEGDGAVLSMVSRGLGMAITPQLSLEGVPDNVEITALEPERPPRPVGYVTTPEQAQSLAARALIPGTAGDRP